MKRAFCLFFAILFVFSFSSCVFTPSHAYPEQIFSKDGLSLVLTEAFSFVEPAPGEMTFALESTHVIVFVRKETFAEIGGAMTLEEYVDALHTVCAHEDPTDVVSPLHVPPESVRETVGGTVVLRYFTYDANDYRYFTTAFVGDDACYMVQFVTRLSTADTYLPHLMTWAAGLHLPPRSEQL